LALIYASPLTPLQPVLTGTPEDFLTGEGGVIGRGRSTLSELTSPSQTNENRVLKIIQFERGIKGVSIPKQIKKTFSRAVAFS
jgi:hypothetical protein